ncbi:MAG: hypothetical protein ABFD45_00925 [Smithella sp.]
MLFIAVLAVYIYRSGDEQVKPILPGAPMPAVEMQKEQPPAQMPQVEDVAAPAVSRKKAVAPENQKQDRQVIGGIAAGGVAKKKQRHRKVSPQRCMNRMQAKQKDERKAKMKITRRYRHGKMTCNP